MFGVWRNWWDYWNRRRKERRREGASNRRDRFCARSSNRVHLRRGGTRYLFASKNTVSLHHDGGDLLGHLCEPGTHDPSDCAVSTVWGIANSAESCLHGSWALFTLLALAFVCCWQSDAFPN